MGTDRHILNTPELYAMYQRGWSLRALGRLLYIDCQTVAARFRRDGLPVDKYHRKVTLQRVAELVHQGYSQTQMAEKLGVSRQLVFRAMERLRAKAPQYALVKRRDSRWHQNGPWVCVPKAVGEVGPGWAMGCAAGLNNALRL